MYQVKYKMSFMLTQLSEEELFNLHQLRVLDFIRGANNDEKPVRKSDVARSVLVNANVITNVLAVCVEENLLIIEKVKVGMGRPSEYLTVTTLGKLLLVKKADEVTFAKEGKYHRARKSVGEYKAKSVKDEVAGNVENWKKEQLPEGMIPHTAPWLRWWNEKMEEPWQKHIFHQDDLKWQNYVRTSEMDELYGVDALELARYYAARYGEKVVTIEETLTNVAPASWERFTTEHVCMILTYATLGGLLRATFSRGTFAPVDVPSLVDWLYWSVVAEVNILGWVAEVGGSTNVLKMYSHWGQGLY
jgi:hypothetical protein